MSQTTMLTTHSISHPSSSSPPLSLPTNTHSHGLPTPTKRKRKPAGTPDPDAQVVYLSPETLMESDHYACEVCGLSFRREQNLQMHRRRHKLPWSLQKNNYNDDRAEAMNTTGKRVYVCPEPRCVHHDPAHALGDLVGIKKHYKRKHTKHRQHVCDKCSKAYAVLSDYKAHLKTCGTRGHSCDCGRIFSRVETFIEHQDSCKARRKETENHQLQTQKEPITSSFMKQVFNFNNVDGKNTTSCFDHNTLDLQELFPTKRNEEIQQEVVRLRSESEELMRIAMEEKAEAEEKRKQAKILMEMASQDMAKATRIREQALVSEIKNSQLIKDHYYCCYYSYNCISCKFKELGKVKEVNYYFPSNDCTTHQGEKNGENNSLVLWGKSS